MNTLSARRGGSRVFASHLIPALAAYDKSIDYTVILPERSEEYFPNDLPGNVKCVCPSYSGYISRFMYEHFRIPFLYKAGRYNAYFQADDVLPPLIYLLCSKTMAVFHESITLLLPRATGDSVLKMTYWKLLKWLALRNVSIPVAMSFCEKGELASGSSKIFKKLQVVYHGIDSGKFHSDSQNDVGHFSIGLPDSFILSVSTRNPHKNYFRIVQAYNLLHKQGKIKEHLVLIGSPVSESEEVRIRQYIREAEIESFVHIFNNLDNFELPAIYRRANAYVYGSLFDSFGFTPLEAMACGVPCAISQFSALPEICGDAAEYFDPLNIQSMADAILVVLNDNDRRSFLISAGLLHAGKFTWEKSAAQYHYLLTSPQLPEWSL